MPGKGFTKESKVLVIDDDSGVRGFLENFLKAKGYNNVLAESTGEGGIRAVEEEADVKLVLLDVILPDMSGIDVLRKIKDVNKEIKVIMVTGHPDEAMVKEAVKAGAHDYIIKPFNMFYLELVLLTKLIQLKLK